MKDYKIELMDIADDLLIINKKTIDTLMKLDNCADCIALYVFYYKTAKWQKTNQIKANDEYVKKSLKWGRDKIMRTKATLKEHGLIDVIQERKDGKISGWYIKLSYIVNKRKIEDCHAIVNKSQNQQVENPTSTEQDVNALREYIKCLKKEIEMLKEENESENNIERKGLYSAIVDELNNVCGTHYKASTKTTRDLIDARIKEGFTENDFFTVIAKKASTWKGTKMEQYLRPQTLFGTKFESYLNEKISSKNPFLDMLNERQVL